jgi:hypothetical protein
MIQNPSQNTRWRNIVFDLAWLGLVLCIVGYQIVGPRAWYALVGGPSVLCMASPAFLMRPLVLYVHFRKVFSIGRRRSPGGEEEGSGV